jgi:hypothetical protein
MKFSPSDVDLSTGLMSTFGKAELETSAEHLIRYLQSIDAENWSFTFAGLYEYYVKNKLNTNEMLFGLLGTWFDDGPMRVQDDMFYIVNWGNGLQVTQEFLKRVSKYVKEDGNVV